MELKQLCELQGISGREELVRAAIYDECVRTLGKENVTIDRMGNVIAHKRGRDADAPHVMVSAHMDEVGLMVISATDEGLLHVRPIGGIDPRVLVSKRVKVGYAVPTRDGKPAQEPLSGVIGAMAIHQQTAEDRKRVLPIDQLYVDIGAKDKDEALEKAPAGTPITFDTAFTPFGEGRILARALDDRIGCYNMLRLLTCDAHGDVDFVFTCQEEVGCRGAKTAAYSVEPDIGIALDVTANGDTPETKLPAVKLGEGAAVKIMDRGSISNPDLVRDLLAAGERAGVKTQREVLPFGGTDAMAMQVSRGGVIAGTVSIPCRYVHSACEVIDLRDVEAARALLLEYLK